MIEKQMTINLGPQHPSTHGVLRVKCQLDGETVVTAEPIIGYLHTGFEKTGEQHTYLQAVTLPDRMDYLSPGTSNLAYVLAVERLLQLQMPPRVDYIRVLWAELSRLASHLVWLGTHVMDLGAMSLFFYTFRERELILDLMEMVAGVRMNPTYLRVGGLAFDLPEGFHSQTKAFLDEFPEWLREYNNMLKNNPILDARLRGVAPLSQEEALAYSVTGPTLRATGLALDLRRAAPYCRYDEFDFEIPVATEGDAYARFWLRVLEMTEIWKILRQVLEKITPVGEHKVVDHKISLPPRHEIYGNMEAMIRQFKLVTEGFRVPKGEAYAAVESPKGEMAFFIVSDGGHKPYRFRARTPSFYNLQSLPVMAKDALIADVVTAIGSLDIVLGDVDR